MQGTQGGLGGHGGGAEGPPRRGSEVKTQKKKAVWGKVSMGEAVGLEGRRKGSGDPTGALCGWWGPRGLLKGAGR